MHEAKIKKNCNIYFSLNRQTNYFIPATVQVLLHVIMADTNIHTAKYICKFVFFLTTTSPWRWCLQRPKHVGEKIVNKIHHKLLSALCWLFTYYGLYCPFHCFR